MSTLALLENQAFHDTGPLFHFHPGRTRTLQRIGDTGILITPRGITLTQIRRLYQIASRLESGNSLSHHDSKDAQNLACANKTSSLTLLTVFTNPEDALHVSLYLSPAGEA